MSMSMMKRTAPLSLLCCGVQNGGGVGGGGGGGVSRFNATVQNFPQKREEELDGYTEVEPLESRLQLQDRERETQELLSQFYRSHSGLPDKSSRKTDKRHPALPSLQRVVDNLLLNHRIAYNGEEKCSNGALT